MCVVAASFHLTFKAGKSVCVLVFRFGLLQDCVRSAVVGLLLQFLGLFGFCLASLLGLYFVDSACEALALIFCANYLFALRPDG